MNSTEIITSSDPNVSEQDEINIEMSVITQMKHHVQSSHQVLSDARIVKKTPEQSGNCKVKFYIARVFTCKDSSNH